MQKILFVLSEYGYWGEELIGPMETLEKAGYILNFATPTGKCPHALPPSMDASFVDLPPYPLEFILRDAVGPGEFHGNVGKSVSVIVDYPFITGRSTADSYKTGELLVQVLKNGMRRYGW